MGEDFLRIGIPTPGNNKSFPGNFKVEQDKTMTRFAASSTVPAKNNATTKKSILTD